MEDLQKIFNKSKFSFIEYIAGIFYGYPKCCIDNFSDQMKKYDESRQRYEWREGEEEIFGGSGFRPCDYHLEMVLGEQITRDELITNRVCTTPFPDSKGKVTDVPEFFNFYKGHIEKLNNGNKTRNT